jgi:hypothetical protein
MITLRLHPVVALGGNSRNQSAELHHYLPLPAGGSPIAGLAMIDRTFIVRFKPPQIRAQSFVASTAEIQGDHIVLLNANGQLAALLLLEVVESWNAM